MKRISLLLIFSLMLSLLFSCGGRNYDEAEVKLAAEDLLEKSIIINEVFYGVGMTADTTRPEISTGAYKPVDENYLSRLGVSTIDGLKSLTAEVYTSGLCDIIFRTKLQSVRDGDDNIISYSRYYEKMVNQQKVLMVYTLADTRYENDIEYLYDTLRVIGSEAEFIKIEIQVKLTTFDGFERTESAEFLLLEEENGFRLDTLSFVKY